MICKTSKLRLSAVTIAFKRDEVRPVCPHLTRIGPLLPGVAEARSTQGVAHLSPSSLCLSSLARSQELLSLAVYGFSSHIIFAHSSS